MNADTEIRKLEMQLLGLAVVVTMLFTSIHKTDIGWWPGTLSQHLAFCSNLQHTAAAEHRGQGGECSSFLRHSVKM